MRDENIRGNYIFIRGTGPFSAAVAASPGRRPPSN
jgi:hypothetical protein